jgi:hypothetical protein
VERGEQARSTARATPAPLGREQPRDVQQKFTGDIECANIGHDAEPSWIEAFCGKSSSIRRSAFYVADARFHPLWAICLVRVAEISSMAVLISFEQFEAYRALIAHRAHDLQRKTLPL